MRAFARKILTWLLFGCVFAIFVAVLGEFFIEVARDKGLYQDAGGKWDTLMSVAMSWVLSPWVLWPLLVLFGAVVALWADYWLKKSERPNLTENDIISLIERHAPKPVALIPEPDAPMVREEPRPDPFDLVPAWELIRRTAQVAERINDIMGAWRGRLVEFKNEAKQGGLPLEKRVEGLSAEELYQAVSSLGLAWPDEVPEIGHIDTQDIHNEEARTIYVRFETRYQTVRHQADIVLELLRSISGKAEDRASVDIARAIDLLKPPIPRP